MLRRISDIALALLLLVTTTGYTISKHYCGTKLVSVAVNSKTKACCDDEKGSCCHDESEHFRLKEDFVPSSVQFNFGNVFSVDLAFLPDLLSGIGYKAENTNDLNVFTGSSPPPGINISLAKLQTYLL
ncbi:MAG: hypothetical protein JW723_15550 [Bacteroidales bacterium]|nr:hypothetical protein [Bacteroidales bacterium]